MPLNTLEDLHAGKLAGSRRLKLACGLTEFPREIFDLAETLEILDLSGNALNWNPCRLTVRRKTSRPARSLPKSCQCSAR